MGAIGAQRGPQLNYLKNGLRAITHKFQQNYCTPSHPIASLWAVGPDQIGGMRSAAAGDTQRRGGRVVLLSTYSVHVLDLTKMQIDGVF